MNNIKNMLITNLLLCLLLMTSVSFMPVQAQDKSKTVRKITQLAGDVYRFQNNHHFSVFMVTDEGVIATDPINADAATWLNTEIKKRFNQTVKYVLYSHDHWDHVSGAEVFEDATIIAHANASKHIAKFEHGIVMPAITFTDKLIVELGDKQVEMFYLGESHSDNLVYMRFPGGILFAVDALSVKRLPYKDFTHVNIDGVIRSLKALEKMDFDIIAPGHGATGTMQDITDHRIYVESLKEQVTKQMKAGKSVDEIKAAVGMLEYKDWGMFSWQPLNVEGMVHYLSQ